MFSSSGGRSFSHLLAAWGCAAMAAALLMGQPTAAQGVRQGLSTCAQTLIPSLFPFMALAGIISALGADSLLARPFSPFLSPLLGIPPQLCGVVFMSFIGGYPVGARLVAQLQREGRIDEEMASRMMAFSFAGAPSFIIGAVGVRLLGGPLQGLAVYLSQLAAAVLIGVLGRFKKGKTMAPLPPSQPKPFSAALVEGVSAAASSMMAICAFACLFAAAVSLMDKAGIFACLNGLLRLFTGGHLPPAFGEAAAAGLLEITCGVQKAAALPYPIRFWLVPFLLSFGSLSVLCQAASCFAGLPFSFGRFIRSRLFHGLLTALLSVPALTRIPLPAQALSQIPQPAPVDSSIIVGLPAMLGMCSVLLLTLYGESAPFMHSKK